MTQQITKNGWKLIDEKTGATICKGDVRESFRGEMKTIAGGTPPHRPNSSGRIAIKTDDIFEAEFFPSVFGAKWVEIL
jgi:hypothetical protein